MFFGRSRRIAIVVFALAVASGAAGVALETMQEGNKAYRRAAEITGGDPHAGEEAVLRYGCGSCHTIPGIIRARGLVGPPLSGFGSRIYIAGVLANNPDNLVRWIQDPPSVSPRTAMPKLGVTDGDARDIAAYLYTLTEGNW
ncbi:c-type cytochrome [Azospirillum melinis]|uniref:C-type cytochrome n=1 Tax=Azospirillum melinis TaxID=328839 RepID=A0ABX2K962_9PROT|nr:c-type cytochrome [Azospirillum melinis]MBP2310606.1 cytochrome c1 [Azospirillum melinis]NUA99070.1 c-type cytochrome [Azospirillum melinis]